MGRRRETGGRRAGPASSGSSVSLRLDDSPRRNEILIDRGHGYFAGERSTITQDIAGLPAGTTITSTTVTTTVVGSVGWVNG